MPQAKLAQNALIVLSAETIEATRTALAEIERLGARILHVYPPHLLIGEVPVEMEARVRAVANVAALHRGRVDPALAQAYGAAAEQAVKGWNRGFAASYMALKSGRAGEGKSWGAPGYAPEGPMRPPHDHREARSAYAGDDTSAYLIGKVAVNIIIVEGMAPPYTLTPLERDTIVAEIQSGLGWLGSQEPKARVSWFYEVRQLSLDLDPATISDFSEDTWRDAALARLGYPASWEGLEQFVRARRAALGVDWSFAVFVTRFPLWHFAYAFRPRIVMSYDLDGWGIDDMDRIVAHETGHIFGAGDEYAESKCSCDELFGYLQVPNGNCELGVSQHEPCIMSHNTWAMCSYTRAQLGWRDSNNDGILDPFDKPVVVKQQAWWEALLVWVGKILGRRA